ncbi:hypothetical protein Bca52824_031418 [Brassica carinata]|uniref:ADP-ribosyl cyclase/cyclic ADP-ribose hydrolase n=1 Tax=Brassica carinata TaxID=52824 RepID=A0A8X7SAM9_BRACI|nr:hypothetical protein Bca52824_031418 [Brassica carinata]
MASYSSPLPRTWRYRVFTSFHGPDVRKTFLSHLRKQFSSNGITMFDDQGIERSQIIAPALTQAIRESRISIILLSKNYASSSWCLDELLDILKCKEDMGQIVMTVFYGVDPSHVRKQTGDFGKAFKETCARKTKEKEERWSQALEYVGNIEGEHFLNWVNEADMIEKIATDVSNKLNATPAKDFDGMVGFEAHLREMESLLDLDNDEVKMVAITGPAGIGKSSIARALHSLLSNRFQLTCFVDNLRGTYPIGLDEYGLKFRLQEELLSKTLNQSSMRICHLGVIEERLHDQKVLIILDDVNNIKQLEALAGDSSWFGPGSRVVVRTENKELLQQHGINNTYHVKFPSRGEALQIFCRYAFRQTYPHDHFEELALKVTALCGNLPLGLRVVGSSLRGKKVDEWEDVMDRLETILDHQDIEQVLRVGYESLHEKEQSLFLHIAVFFSCKYGDLVKAMFADNNSDIKHGLKILANKSLIYLSEDGKIVMHKLLHVGTKVVHKEKPWKRRILTDAQVISDVLERAKGTRDVSGISFDISEIDEVFLSPKAFKRMPNLRFLKIYKSKDSGNDIFHIPDEMVFPRGLRLLHWEACPSKSLPLGFCLENLVELHMPHSHLEKLWEGTQPLTNLKKMNLSWSSKLKELPDLSNAASFERLELFRCESLVEIHSSIGNLQSIDFLQMGCCTKLQVVPALFNLAPHSYVSVEGCSQLRNIPDFSRNIRAVVIADTMIKELPRSVNLSNATNLEALKLSACKSLVELPSSISSLGKLNDLWMVSCTKLEVVPTNWTFASLNPIDIEISGTNMTTFGMSVPAAKEVPPANALSLPREFSLALINNPNLKTLAQFPMTITSLNLSYSGMETICCIKDLHMLEEITLFECTELKSLPELPVSLKSLEAYDCESLQTVFCPLNTPFAKLSFTKCFKLDQQARNEIIHQRFHRSLHSGWSCLPGNEVPTEFEHRAMGNTLSFPLSAFSKFKVCLVCSPNSLPVIYNYHYLSCRRIRKGFSYPIQRIEFCRFYTISPHHPNHLFVFHSDLLLKYGCLKESGELTFEFTSEINYFDVIECGVQILKEVPDGSNNVGSCGEDGDEFSMWDIISLIPSKFKKQIDLS